MKRSLIAMFASVVLAACGNDMEPGRQKVKERLKDPLSAQFQKEQIGKKPALFCGEVNSKNSMGGYVGFKRYIVMPEYVAFDRDETALQLHDESANSTAQDEVLRKRLLDMTIAKGSTLTERESLEALFNIYFQESWAKVCAS